ncbi:glucose-repressible alcohol dehydrogenase transcriptional effector [Lentinula aff. lateritia]|uniref:Glucose-repressible alcohol dehydrogenase transcriptional effector n=1 Tax=Lentinula aff. lateritia TaxID=2804960 RepID=A0ACC1UD85_9AGAR|nr:glucose-repressible alcohol dehydrogenase transcriptional effector [Lentinula aff. lateritia]
MYFTGGQKLGTESWPRQPVGGPPPPTSPGYGIYSQPQHHHQHSHLGPPLTHHQILSGQQPPQNLTNHTHNHNHNHTHTHHNPHYPSPPIQQHHVGINQGSPASAPLAQHWQQQLLKCEIIRQSRSPHHRARASAMASRTVAKSAIPITNPNPNPKPPPEEPLLSDSPPLANGNASHPSSTVAPIAEPPRPRSEATWTSLDMGGVGIKNLPSNSGLFSFNFLTNLYLNHNGLIAIPPEIAQLRNLELLDLSGNALTTLPPELGMLVSMKEFYLFDNQIMTIPPEFGTLHQLQTLGVEGNPLDTNLKNLITKDGTPALIAFLRDSCPVSAPPQNRAWIPLITPVEQEALSPSTETISVVCYNILCQRAATVRLYGYTPSWALAWDYRRELILSEILAHGADFICLQEVDVTSYEDFFLKHLSEAGYESVYWPKSRAKTMSNENERRFVDGLATFFRADKYQLIEKHLIEFSAVAMQREDFKKTEDMFNRVLGKDHIATACAFENRETGSRVLVANVHILWDPKFCDVKLVHVALMVEEVEKMAERFLSSPFPTTSSLPSSSLPPSSSSSSPPDSPSSKPSTRRQRPKPPTYTSASQIPLIFCGDFNSIPGSGVYEFLSTGTLRKDHPDFMGHVYGKYTGAHMRRRHMVSSTSSPSPELLPTTNYVSSFSGVLDYIWYSNSSLGVNAVLGQVDPVYMSKCVGFPNVHFPSDHICIMAEFRVKPPRETSSSSKDEHGYLPFS